MMDEMSASLIRYADNGGLIPRGPCAGGYTYIMSGCPATPLIVSTYNKGLMTKCDPMHAFKTMQPSGISIASKLTTTSESKRFNPLQILR